MKLNIKKYCESKEYGILLSQQILLCLAINKQNGYLGKDGIRHLDTN